MDNMVELITGVVAGLTVGVLSYLFGKTRQKMSASSVLDKLDIEKANRDVLQETLMIASHFALNRLKDPETGRIDLKHRSAFAGFIMDYLAKFIPETLASFGIDLSTKEGKSRIMDMIDARINDAVFISPTPKIVKEEDEKPVQKFDA